MLFSPENEKLWDTWLVERDQVFYLFYIRISPQAGSSGALPKLGEGWDGISLATSTDLLHWTQHGPVLEKHPDAAWLGTGMIHRVGDRYVMNFSEERPAGQQTVSFAVSTDLYQWERLPEAHDLPADERWYQVSPSESADPLPRWDSLGVISPASDDEPYRAFICANATNTLPGQCGTLGLLESDDGYRWSARPPVIQPGLFPSYEVPEHVAINGRHYVLFSTNSTAGPRFDGRTVHPHSGTYYVVADQVEGPYRMPDTDPMLLGHRMLGPMLGTYVGRPFLTSSGELLLYHQWTSDYPRGSWGPPKRLVESGEHELALEYWPGCDRLKSTVLLSPSSLQLESLPTAGHVPVMEFAVRHAGIDVVNRGGASGVRVPLAEPAAETEFEGGRVVEARVRIDAGRGIGLWIGCRGTTAKTAVLLNASSQSVEIGKIAYHKDGASMTFDVMEARPLEMARGAARVVRLLYRRSFLDIYVDDSLVTSFTDRQVLDATEFGVYAELSDGRVDELTAWAMA